MSEVEKFVKALPASIKIGGYDIAVLVWKPLEAAVAKRWGEFSAVEQCIRIDPSTATMSKLVDTVLHEIGHAIWWASCIDEGDKEERIVGMSARAWMQVWRDNPVLLGWLVYANDEIRGVKRRSDVEINIDPKLFEAALHA